MKFLIYPAVDENELQAIQSVSSDVDIQNVENEDQALEIIDEIDAMYGRITPELLARAKNCAGSRPRWQDSNTICFRHWQRAT